MSSSEEQQREGDQGTASSRRSKGERRPLSCLDNYGSDVSISDYQIKGTCGRELDADEGENREGGRRVFRTCEREQEVVKTGGAQGT